MNEIKPLSVIDYSFQYQIRETLALKKLNFEIEKGEILLIAGSSGCGKTTLMRSINGLIPYSYNEFTSKWGRHCQCNGFALFWNREKNLVKGT